MSFHNLVEEQKVISNCLKHFGVFVASDLKTPDAINVSTLSSCKLALLVAIAHWVPGQGF